MLHEQMVRVVKSNAFCMNCLDPNHFVKQCKSVQRCKQSKKLLHTLRRVDATPVGSTPALANPNALTDEELS